jgi:hypothetical protein
MTASGPITFHIPRRLRFASLLTPSEGVADKNSGAFQADPHRGHAGRLVTATAGR